MGGWEKRGEENLPNDSPPKECGFEHRTVGTFSTLWCRRCVFPLTSRRLTDQTQGSCAGVHQFSGGCVLWCVVLCPYVLQLPACHGLMHSNCKLRNVDSVEFLEVCKVHGWCGQNSFSEQSRKCDAKVRALIFHGGCKGEVGGGHSKLIMVGSWPVFL